MVLSSEQRSTRRIFNTRNKSIAASTVAHLTSSTYWNPEQPSPDRNADEPYSILNITNLSSIDIEIYMNGDSNDREYLPGNSSGTIDRDERREFKTIAVKNTSSALAIAADLIYITMRR